MISFGMSDEQKAAQEAMRNFAKNVLRAKARSCDEAAGLPDDFLKQAWELGLTMAQIPEAYGGMGTGRSCVTNAIVLEELGYGDVPLAMAALAPSLFANAVVDLGSEEQKKKYLPAFCGEKFETGSLALLEPGALFDLGKLKTTAEARGGGFVLQGRKSFVPFGDRAGHFLVIAKCGNSRGAFIVPRDAKGLKVSEPQKNLGLNALPLCGLDLGGVEIPKEARLGAGSDEGVQRIIDNSRVALSALLVGLARGVLDYCVPYAREREAFDEAIAKKQAIAFLLADMHIEVESMRWLVWRAASALDQGRAATQEAHQAYSYTAEKSMWIADNGIQVLGGHGFIREHPVEMWFRNARTASVLEGAVAV